jgi:mannose-6-phosphate isomerase-like protein (cupin superfamily)
VSVNLVPADGGEVIQLAAGHLRVLEDGTNTGHRVGIAEFWIPPKTPGPPQHVHREHDETFFVLTGALDFTSGTDTSRVLPGGLVTAPIGTPHTFANPDPDEAATFLFTSTPDLYLNYFRDLSGATKRPGGLTRDVILEIMSNYATEPYLP